MTSVRTIDLLLGDIVEWSKRIERYVRGMDFAEFQRNEMAQDAVIRCLEIVGEASAQILKAAPEFQDDHPELELRQAYRARNRTAHGYGSINLDTIWRSAIDAAPRIASAAERILDERRKRL